MTSQRLIAPWRGLGVEKWAMLADRFELSTAKRRRRNRRRRAGRITDASGKRSYPAEKLYVAMLAGSDIKTWDVEQCMTSSARTRERGSDLHLDRRHGLS